MDTNLSCTNYDCVVVPSTMRSLYWKYFGFPADNNNRIITKSKIICIICKGIITYNKNTTNLRTHLVAKHADLLLELNNERKKIIIQKEQQQYKRIKKNKQTYFDDNNQTLSLPTTETVVKTSSSSSLPTIQLESVERTTNDDILNSSITIINHQESYDIRCKEDEEKTINDDNKNQKLKITKIKQLQLNNNDSDSVVSMMEALNDTTDDDDDDNEDDDDDDDDDDMNFIDSEEGRINEGIIEKESKVVISSRKRGIKRKKQQQQTVNETTNDNYIDENQTFERNIYSITIDDNPQNSISSSTINNKINTESNSSNSNSNNNGQQVMLSITTTHNDIQIPSIETMIIKDLLPITFIDGKGFQEFIKGFMMINNQNNSINIPKIYDIECSLRKIYDEKYEKIMKYLKIKCNQYKFSLSMEIWKNIENKNLLSIYINYNEYFDDINEIGTIINEEENFNKKAILLNILYKTIELKNINEDKQLQQRQKQLKKQKINNDNMEKELIELFNEINLKNCSVAVINKYDNIVNNFLKRYDIPTIMCFETIINLCLEKIFELSEINEIFKNVVEQIELNCDNIEEFSTAEYLNDNPCSKYNLLHTFCDYMPWVEENNEFLLKVKKLKEILQPLKITLETLADEPIALCSLVKPFTQQLLNEHFSESETDDEIISKIKKLLCEELIKHVMNNEFYTEAAFFDPRFQSFMHSNEIQQIRQNLCEKFNKDHEQQQEKDNKLKINNIKKEDNRKSSLKQFFNRSVEHPTNNNTNKTNINLEILKYIKDADYVDLEKCPLEWWSEYGSIYRNLKKIAKKYFCVPCCCNNIFRLNQFEQIQFLNRRYQLKRSAVNYLWFLHYNREVF